MKAPHIVVVGSLNMDLVVSTPRLPRIGETLKGDSIHYIPGGKGANQAVGCARLGAQVTMIGAVGDDVFGRQIVREMERNGVSTKAIDVLEGMSTGTATILHTPDDNCIVIVPGANGQITAERIERHREMIEHADLVIMQLEIPMDAVSKAIAIAHEAKVPTVLNPAPASVLPAEMAAAVDWLTPNETEFEILANEGPVASLDAMKEAMRRWEKRYGSRMLVTLGERGACFLEDGELSLIEAPVVTPVDTTGAGDCLNAAFSFGLATGKTIKQSVSFAVRAASLSVMRFGAQAGMPTLPEVDAWKVE